MRRPASSGRDKFSNTRARLPRASLKSHARAGALTAAVMAQAETSVAAIRIFLTIGVLLCYGRPNNEVRGFSFLGARK
jgi:hypothetical protein